MFIGDDVSDESGFEYVNEVGGMSVRVRPAARRRPNYVLETLRRSHKWIGSVELVETHRLVRSLVATSARCH